MMNKELTLDDMKIGMYITVSNWTNNDQSSLYVGDVLRVLAINCPFLAVKILGDKWHNNLISLDLREAKIIQITREFVEALLPNIEVEPDPFWDNINKVKLQEELISPLDINLDQ